MKPRLALGLIGFAACVLAADPTREVYYRGAVRADGIPIFARGYLIYVRNFSFLTVYGPDGFLKYDAELKAPPGKAVWVADVAIDSDGTAVAAVAYDGAPYGVAGAFVFLDAAGKQTGFASTNRYLPVGICLTEAHFIWSVGWQRGLDDDREDRQSYMVFRKYARNGREVGAYVPRSSVPRPFGSHGGLRVANDRLGALVATLATNRTPPAWHWVELGFDGKLIGCWKLDRDHHSGGIAFTAQHGLYTLEREEEEDDGPVWRLKVFDRSTSSWKPLDAQDYNERRALVGADGNELVFHGDSMAVILRWYPAPE